MTKNETNVDTMYGIAFCNDPVLRCWMGGSYTVLILVIAILSMDAESSSLLKL